MNDKKKKIFKIISIFSMIFSVLALTSCKSNPIFDLSDYSTNNYKLNVANSSAFLDFSTKKYEDKVTILASLEKYIMDNFLTGIPLNGDDEYDKINLRIEIPTKLDSKGKNIFIPGYGFGIIEEGKIKSALPSAIGEYRMFYHGYETVLPASLNYQNDKTSTGSTHSRYVTTSYYAMKMTDSKDGYEYFPSLAKCAPIPLDSSDNESSTLQKSSKYRIYLRTGKDGFKYGTYSIKNKEFNGREVSIDDYLTSWIVSKAQKYNLKRSGETLTGPGSIKGMQEYYQKSSDPTLTFDALKSLFEKTVGIKKGNNSKGEYLDIEFNNEDTIFYTQYYLSSTTISPYPLDFIKKIGSPSNYGSISLTSSPVDNLLSTGPYAPLKVEPDKGIVYKKNPYRNDDVLGGNNRYQIEGLNFVVLKGLDKDPNLAFREFMLGKLDFVKVPKDYIKTQKDQKDVFKTQANSVWKLNLNTTTKEEWERLFGVNGSVTKTPKRDYWNVKPAMSNAKFIKGLQYSINRREYAENRGSTGLSEYFADSYQLPNDEGKLVSYNSTKQHQENMNKYFDKSPIYDASGNRLPNGGYSLDAAVGLFKEASKELIQEGHYKKGDKIVIEIAWRSESDKINKGKDIKYYMETAFNDFWGMDEKLLSLEVVNTSVADPLDIYYKKMFLGQFDLADGSIGGKNLNPIDYLSILESNFKEKFTLSWHSNTNDPKNSIELKLKDSSLSPNPIYITFDALIAVSTTGSMVAGTGSKDDAYYIGNEYDAKLIENIKQNNGTRKITILYGSSSNYQYEGFKLIKPDGNFSDINLNSSSIEKYGNYYKLIFYIKNSDYLNYTVRIMFKYVGSNSSIPNNSIFNFDNVRLIPEY